MKAGGPSCTPLRTAGISSAPRFPSAFARSQESQMCPESISLVVHPPDPIFSSEPQSGLDALQHCLTISLSSADSFRASCVEVASHTPRHMIARSLGDVPRSRGCSSVRVEPTDGTRPQWLIHPAPHWLGHAAQNTFLAFETRAELRDMYAILALPSPSASIGSCVARDRTVPWHSSLLKPSWVVQW